MLNGKIGNSAYWWSIGRSTGNGLEKEPLLSIDQAVDQPDRPTELSA